MSAVLRERCNVCGASVRPRTYSGFDFLQCPNCGFALLRDAVSRGDYWAADAEADSIDTHFWIDAKRTYFECALELLAAMSPGRRLIDVGGGVGFFAELALAAGWDSYSLDVSPRATALAAARVGDERALSTLGPDACGTFDVATLWCVVAHTTCPGDIVATAHSALRPGGVLWLTTPNFTYHKWYASVRRMLGNPGNFATDEHIGQFTKTSISHLLRRAGFSDVAFHYAGVVETCLVANSDRRALVSAKKAWNRSAYALAEVGLPNAMSELQVSARAREAGGSSTRPRGEAATLTTN